MCFQCFLDDAEEDATRRIHHAEAWLNEADFYQGYRKAIRDVRLELAATIVADAQPQ